MSKIRQRLTEGGKNILPRTPAKSISFDDYCPHFSLEHVADAYCITRCAKEDRAAFAVQLRKLSQLTWKELRRTPHEGFGCEVIDRNQIRAGIPSNVTEDVDKFLAFRFSGKKPMVGYRDERVFHILWFDRDFSLYDHGS